MNGKFKNLPPQLWKNKFPIVLVHGFFGYGPDAYPLLGNYFEYAMGKHVLKNHQGDVYIAVVSPTGCIHDRACELYQQLVGITQIRNLNGLRANDNGPNLVKAVYGDLHFF